MKEKDSFDCDFTVEFRRLRMGPAKGGFWEIESASVRRPLSSCAFCILERRD